MTMKTILSHGLALSLIGTAFLACARPIASNADILVQPRVNSTSIYPDLSNSDGLTRRSPVIIIKHTDQPEVHEIKYDTPLDFMNSVVASQASFRRHQIDLWKTSRVTALEAKVDSLKGFGLPLWLVHECWDQLNREARRTNQFSREEAGSPHLLETIQQHMADIVRLREKLLEHKPWPEFHPPPSDLELMKPTDLCPEDESQIHNVQVDPSPDISPTPLIFLNNPEYQISSYGAELQAKARRDRIMQWKGGQATALKANLPTSGIPVWLFEDCYREIANTQALIQLFDSQEQIGLYRAEMQKYKAEIGHLRQAVIDMRKEGVTTHLNHLRPKIKAGGSWRDHIQSMIIEVERSHSPTEIKALSFEFHAGFQMYREMMALGLAAHQDQELARFRRFLCTQQKRFKKGKDAEPDPPIS